MSTLKNLPEEAVAWTLFHCKKDLSYEKAFIYNVLNSVPDWDKLNALEFALEVLPDNQELKDEYARATT